MVFYRIEEVAGVVGCMDLVCLLDEEIVRGESTSEKKKGKERTR
jgi:hypothetical protein